MTMSAFGSSQDVAVPVAAKLFRGFADATRLAILLTLTEGERRVVDLVREVGSSQPNVSGHLSCLKDCGLVVDRPEGRQIFYRIAFPEVYDVLRAAEEVLAATGIAIELCPNYGPSRSRRGGVPVARSIPAGKERIPNRG